MHPDRTYRRHFLFGLIAGIILIFSVSSPASAGPFAGQEKVHHAAVIEKAERGEVQDLIVVFDDNAAVQRAAVMRSASGANHDTPDILREKSLLYGAKKQEVVDSLTTDDAEVIDDYEHLPMMFLRVKSMKGLEKLSSQPGITGIYENGQYTLMLNESLPLIGQPQAASAGYKGGGTAVAVLDSGVDYTHVAFGSCTGGNTPGYCSDANPPPAHAGCRVACVRDIAPDDGMLDDFRAYPYPGGHGTNVSGIVAGVAPDTKIIGLDVLDGASAYANDIIDAINWVITNKAVYNIVAINMSLGSSKTYSNPCGGDVFASPVANARSAGVLSAVASGNSSDPNGISSPGCVPAAVSVGAVYDGGPGTPANSEDTIPSWSNSASFLTMLAPGSVITAAGISMQGTSQATPHIAGSIAVLKGVFSAETPDQTVSRMTATGKPVLDTRNGITKARMDLVSAINLAFTISGKVISPKGLPVEGVTIDLSGQATATTLTDADGAYSFADVEDGAYTVTPSMGGVTFTPAGRNVTVNGSSASVKDITANVYDITGRVLTSSGVPVAGVTMTLGGAADDATTTDSSGKYAFRQISDGTYTVTPAKTGYAFTPASKTISISGADAAGRNFTAITYAIIGYVRTPSGAPMAGVTVSLTGDAVKTKTTDSTGHYRFGDLPNGNYVVTPSKTGRTFSPASRDVVISGAAVRKQNFVRNP